MLQPDDKRRIVLGADASTTRDLTALVGCWFNPTYGTVDVVYMRAWRPIKGELRGGKPTVDLNATVKAEIARMHKAGQVAAVCYDRFQMHSIVTELEQAGATMIEMPQAKGRAGADQALYDAVIGRTIRHYNSPTLNQSVCNAVVADRAEYIQFEKGGTPNDPAVALSMAHKYCRELGVVIEPYGETVFAEQPVYIASGSDY